MIYRYKHIYYIIFLSFLFEYIRTSTNEKDAIYWIEEGKKTIKEKIKYFKEIGYSDNLLNLKPKNAILFIGDGMGLSTVTASRIFKGQKDGLGKDAEKGSLSFEKFPFTGLIKTFCLDYQVSDSSSTASAYLSGVKANFATGGVSGNVLKDDCPASLRKENRPSSIIQWAQEEGKKTGIVTNTKITHATPAGTYAHIADRNWEYKAPKPCNDIATQLIHEKPGSQINVIFGGGYKGFIPIKDGGLREDSVNLIDNYLKEKKETGKFIKTRQELINLDTSKIEHVLGLFSPENMNYNLDRNREQEPSLPEMTWKAIQMLKNNTHGFVMVVEGGEIDMAHHLNMAKYAFDEVYELDEAVKIALNEVQLNETLILVTADHSHTLTINGYPNRGSDILGFAGTDKSSYPYTTIMYGNGPGYYGNVNKNLSLKDLSAKSYMYKSSTPFDNANHGGEDVPIYAFGPKSWMFSGVSDQTYIANCLSYILCMGPQKELCSK